MALVSGFSAIVSGFGAYAWQQRGATSHWVKRFAHLVGTCRMGASPRGSVVDQWCRSWDVPNLFVCDGSVLPTQGSANPALTISAIAARTADWIHRTARTEALRSRARTPAVAMLGWAVRSWREPADSEVRWEQ